MRQEEKVEGVRGSEAGTQTSRSRREGSKHVMSSPGQEGADSGGLDFPAEEDGPSSVATEAKAEF